MKRAISVFGLGYVGVVSWGCLARDGHSVIGVDIDEHKLALFNQKISPIREEGIQELIEEAVDSGRATVTNDAEYALQHSEISFICVGTPSMPNGSQSLDAMKRLAMELGQALRKISGYRVFVIRSTVIPGTTEKVIGPILEEYSGKTVGVDFGLCFQPEFMREGSSIKDYDKPPFTVVGGDSEKSVSMVREVFEDLPCEFFDTSIQTSEMLKYCCNIFHALKITFANEIGRVCQVLQADSHAVMDLLCKDTVLNISPAYLKPGFAYGGSCLPKDLKALTYLAKMNDVQIPVLSHVELSNRVHIDHAINIILDSGKKSIGMVGLSFKGGTDDLRESPLVVMAEQFIGKGLQLKILDPKVRLSRLMGANKRYIETTIPHIASLMCEHSEELIESSEVFVVAHKDTAFFEQLYAKKDTDYVVLDLIGAVDETKIKGRYQGVCW